MKKQLYKFLILSVVALMGCNKSTQYDLPVVTTVQPVFEAATGTVWSGGNVPGDDYYISAYGICWSTTNSTPTIADTKTSETLSRLAFVSSISDLAAGTTCYVRAYASNETGTSYGEVYAINISSANTIDVQVSTLAGNSTAGFTDGNGNSALFNYPMGLWADQSGDLYVADSYNSAIRKVTQLADVITISGDGTIGYIDGHLASAQFYACSGITGDNQGNLFVADRGNNIIRKLSDGEVTTLAGTGTAGLENGNGNKADFNTPVSITVNASGYLFVADYGNNLIRKIAPDGVVSTFAGNTAAGYINRTGTDASFNKPNAIAIDSEGNLFIAEAANHAIRKIDANGVVSTVIGGPDNSDIVGDPTGLIVDAQGNLYICDGAGRILKLDTDHILTVIAGSSTTGFADGKGSSALFNNPQGLTIDPSGNLYVADYGNQRIRKIAIAKI
ncbi:hypothetical protein LT679_03885 [Mucilaginibacter roseus]|uniref:SMP-30/Gluconolactonase/LRE-like region domain-containing protein n=1 Tax=Mucilaginibacter roseus TaxID=1528868 RepID=A0ABS8U2I3_9SPHI|nr:NHL repeat-containing protein [Mucilaginibacter roseus]MCD8739733.1 hypothetical protein [Mucilaginibacter roseus]